MNTLLIAISLFFLSTNVVAMSQSEFVQRLKNTHPFFIQQNFTQQISNLNYTKSTANQDWRLGASANSNKQSSEQTASVSLSAAHTLVDSGGEFSLTNSWNENTSSDEYSINYTHPLLKNSHGVNTRLSSDLSQIETKITALQLAQQQKEFILSQLFKLVDLSFAQQQLALTTQRLELSQQELNLAKDKFAQSVVDKVDVLLEEDAYQFALQKQLLAEQTLDLLKQELAIILDLSFATIRSDYDIYQPYSLNISNLRTYLQDNSLEMQLEKLQNNLLIRQLKSDKSNTQVQLDLTLGASNESNKSWNVGLGLSYPLGDTEAKSALETTQINLTKAKENTAELLLELTVKASVLKRKISHLEKLLNSYQRRIKIATERATEEKRRYELGNTPVSFVISAQNNVQDVRLGYAQEAVKYQKSVLEFKAVIDQLL
jgi:outer membrane protein TolC